MNKIRSDSILNRLSAAQREQVEGWLFEEGAAYAEVRDRAKKQWNILCSTSAVGRFYRRKLKLRTLEELDEARETARSVNATKAELPALRSAALKVVGKRLLERAMDNGDVKELSALGRILSDGEKRDLQRQRLALSRQKFEFNAAEAALAQLPYIHEMQAEDREREERRLAAIRRRLFGDRLPDDPLFDHLRQPGSLKSA